MSDPASCDLFQIDELDIPIDPFQIDVLGDDENYSCRDIA